MVDGLESIMAGTEANQGEAIKTKMGLVDRVIDGFQLGVGLGGDSRVGNGDRGFLTSRLGDRGVVGNKAGVSMVGNSQTGNSGGEGRGLGEGCSKGLYSRVEASIVVDSNRVVGS